MSSSLTVLCWTGFQAAIGSIVTSSNSVVWRFVKIPQMYWSISKPSSNAVLLQLRTSDQFWFLTKMTEDKQCCIILIACCYNPIISMKDNTYLQTGHRHEPRSVFSCRYDSRSKHCMCLHSWPRAGSIIRRNVIGHLSDTLMAVCSTPSSPFKLLLFVTLVKFRLTGKKIDSKMSNMIFQRTERLT